MVLLRGSSLVLNREHILILVKSIFPPVPMEEMMRMPFLRQYSMRSAFVSVLSMQSTT